MVVHIEESGKLKALKFLTDWSEIKKRKPQKINAISAWGDLGGYGIA